MERVLEFLCLSIPALNQILHSCCKGTADLCLPRYSDVCSREVCNDPEGSCERSLTLLQEEGLRHNRARLGGAV